MSFNIWNVQLNTVSVRRLARASWAAAFFALGPAYANPQQLILGHAGTQGSMYSLTANEFARRVNEKLAGRYEIVVKGGGSLGGEEAVAELARKGDIAFGLSYAPLVKSMPAFGAFGLPYLVLTRKHVREVRSVLLEKYLVPVAQRKGLALLALWDNGFLNVTSSVRPVGTPGDLRGLKIGLLLGSGSAPVFKFAGAEVQEVTLEKIHEMIQHKQIDAEELPVAEIPEENRTGKYLSLTSHIYQPIFLFSSSEQFARISQDAREIIVSVAKDLEDWSLEMGEREELKKLGELRRTMTVNEIDKFSFVLASVPAYQEFAKTYPACREIVKLLWEPSAFGSALIN
jgi:TRAP-type transport system periplasmic protein